MSLSEAFINHALGTSEDGCSLSEVKSLSLKMKDLSADEWLLHRFVAVNLVGRSGSLDSISLEDLLLISAISQNIKLNFGGYMIGKIRSVYKKVVKRKLLSSKRVLCLPYGKYIYKILVALRFSTEGLQILPATEGSMDHVSLLQAHFYLYQGN